MYGFPNLPGHNCMKQTRLLHITIHPALFRSELSRSCSVSASRTDLQDPVSHRLFPAASDFRQIYFKKILTEAEECDIVDMFCWGRFPERPKGADCKSVVTDFGGSNPPSPTIKGLQNRCSPWKPRFYRGFHRLYGKISANRFDRYKNDVFPLLDVLNSHTTE